MDSRKGRNGSRRIALCVQYDGTHYNGWQVQSEGKGITIQNECTKAIYVLTKEKVNLIASGRTDSGVHALGQIAHFDTCSNAPLSRFVVGLNGILPKDISIINCYEVTDDFHARFSAVEREYRYLIHNHPYRSPFMQYRAMWVREKIDVDKWNEWLQVLQGEHDFASFCKAVSAEHGTMREVIHTYAEKNEHQVQITIKGNAFLHNMIRIIIGTLVSMTHNGYDSQFLEEVLRKRDRNAAGPTAPPYGLYLKNVIYHPLLDSYPSAIDEISTRNHKTES